VTITGHTRPVLALATIGDRGWLASGPPRNPSPPEPVSGPWGHILYTNSRWNPFLGSDNMPGARLARAGERGERQHAAALARVAAGGVAWPPPPPPPSLLRVASHAWASPKLRMGLAGGRGNGRGNDCTARGQARARAQEAERVRRRAPALPPPTRPQHLGTGLGLATV
jgi:hypothetical protein